MLKQKLDSARKELLDLSLRNPLLNYRPLRSKGMEIIYEKSDELHKILVLDGKKMTFLAHEVDTEESTADEFELSDPEAAYKDLKLQTRYSEKELNNRLLSTYLAAKTCIEETGVNTLFLVLGMMKWSEAQHSEKENWAPLVLVPVFLERSTARERFTINFSEDEIEINVSLVAKLKSDFSIDINYESDDFQIDEYFDFIERTIDGQKSWQIERDKIAVGFFSFSKYLMYLDLDIDKWENNIDISDNTILNALLENGFREKDSTISDDDHLDQHILPVQIYNVMDADSSQTLAISDVNRGRNLVIQGPPGTGKSQTITNIIAEVVARGKKVLFVSEKMAALDVVKRRLTTVGLGEACLELHSHKTNKKDLLKELEKTMQLGKPKVESTEEYFINYGEAREALNKYCESVNTPIKPSHTTPIEAYGVLLRIQQFEKMQSIIIPRISSTGSHLWLDKDYSIKYHCVSIFQEHAKNMKDIKTHPYKGLGRELLLPADVDSIVFAAKESKLVLEEFVGVIQTICTLRNLTKPCNISETKKLVAGLAYVSTRSEFEKVNTSNVKWRSEADEILHFVELGQEVYELNCRLGTVFVDKIWDVDVEELRQNLSIYATKWWRGLSKDYRKARAIVNGYQKTPTKISAIDQIALLDDIYECKKSTKKIIGIGAKYQVLFGDHYIDVLNTRWDKLKLIVDWVIELHRQINSGIMSSEMADYAERAISGELLTDNKHSQSLQHGISNLESKLMFFEQAAKMDWVKGFSSNRGFADILFELLLNSLNKWIDETDFIHEYGKYNLYVNELIENELNSIFELSIMQPESISWLVMVLEKDRFESLVTKAMQERTELARFDQLRHELLRESFVKMDIEISRVNRNRILKMHWERMPKDTVSGNGQVAILKREFQKKSRHMPIRKLITSAGNAIQSLKPVMMMSPLSIANFIEPGMLNFDLVVFDEASQVKPVEAFGALLRCKQAVVVGDSQQMPPTSFFDRTIIGDEEDEDDENAVSDIESILGLFLSKNAPQRMLRWHYRSRHESLIAVSNKEFYDSKLVIFPSAVERNDQLGLVFHHLKEAFYIRGGNRSNQIEAKIVAEHVMQHAKEHPELTLGVAAFSMSQMNAIFDEIEKIRRSQPELEHFFNDHKDEPFFVKNLENVQGDERDVIFISIGYGKSQEGYLAMNFGPLNREGGHRRLNVLITRARTRCEVFSNITANDIDLSRSSARGVQCLKEFLNYAEKGIIDIGIETGKDFDSDFEKSVFKELKNRGHEVRAQIGCSGFYIDLAVVDPNFPGKYLLGIECDGATYHSARSARDRDRLRQMVLENKGWNIYRIWSTDWFKNSNNEMDKLDRHIQKLVALSIDNIQMNHENQNQDIQSQQCSVVERINTANIHGGTNIKRYSMFSPRESIFLTFETYTELIPWVEKIVAFEGPIHHDELIRRIATIGGKRVGKKISDTISKAIDRAVKQESVVQHQEFYSISGRPIVIRSRETLPQANKKIDYVCQGEIELAIKHALRVSCGLVLEEIAGSALKIIGFTRKNEEIEQRIMPVISKLIKEGQISMSGNSYVCKKGVGVVVSK